MKKWLWLLILIPSLVSANEITDFLDAFNGGIFVKKIEADIYGKKEFENYLGKTTMRYLLYYNDGELSFEGVPENALNSDDGFAEIRLTNQCRFTPSMEGIIESDECKEMLNDLITSL
jgi:hypothetical protein